MKKLLLVAAMAAMTLNVALWSQTITVTSPTTGNDWCLGSTHTITWTKSGAMQATAGIRLRAEGSTPGAEPTQYIVDGTANDGSYSWTIPNSIAQGNYFIRVKTDDGTVVGDSGIFHISNCAASSITVTSPNGTEWATGSTHNITWTSTGSLPATMDIRLRITGSAVGAEPAVYIVDGTANDGSYSWTVPCSVAAGNYFMRVKTSDATVIGDSVNFHIKKGCVIDPGILERLKQRRQWEIKWPPEPGPCMCPEWDIRDLRELLGDKFIGSLVLLKNGVKLQELGAFGRSKAIGGSVKANLSRRDFGMLKNGGAKFSIAILDANGSILNESELQGGQEVLR